jgi:hypothetical protein
VHPLIVATLATLVAVAQVAGWACLGSIVRSDEHDEAAIVFALLIGSSLTAFAYAVLSYYGLVKLALVTCASANAIAIVLRRRWLTRMVAQLFRLVQSQKWPLLMPWAIAAVLLLLWVNAGAPPRDGDVMRYHLAHVRQILIEGRWVPLSDYHYALPFGWTLNFLPFEWLRLPEAAHMVTLLTWCVMVLAAVAWLRRRAAGALSIGFVAVVALQPYVLKSVTTAHADLYCMLVVLAAAMVLTRADALRPTDGFFLGFAAWIGAQSRYQLVAVGLTSMVLVGILMLRARLSRRGLAAYALGSAIAWALASPFYLANLLFFGNPVWPLFVRQINGVDTYTNRIANRVNESLTGTFQPTDVLVAVRGLLLDPLVAPLPIALLLLCALTIFVRITAVRRLGLFAATLAVVWFCMQPSLYPRFVVLFVPLILLGIPLILDAILGHHLFVRARRPVAALLCVGAALFLVVDFWYSKDSARFMISGDRPRFHRATWFYPAYSWINDSLPRDARLLVIVGSGHSYYLDRWYRKADPFLNGEVDWEGLPDGAAFLALLRERRLDYVVFEDRDWSTVLGGSNMQRIFSETIRSRGLVPVRQFELDLVTSRVRGTSEPSKLLVLRRAS